MGRGETGHDSGAPRGAQPAPLATRDPVALPFTDALVPGRLVRRRMRFLADVVLDDGREVTAHCVNTGRMTGCATPGSRVWLSPAHNPKRKLPWTWELVDAGTSLVGIHTARANDLAELAVRASVIPALRGYPSLRREVRYGAASRCDLLLEGAGPPCWVEVKNTTLVEGSLALFPDAVSERGTKHLHELRAQVESGARAAMLFVVQRTDATAVAPADAIDPVYGRTLREVVAAGVEAYGLLVRPTPPALIIEGTLPVVLPPPRATE